MAHDECFPSSHDVFHLSKQSSAHYGVVGMQLDHRDVNTWVAGEPKTILFLQELILGSNIFFHHPVYIKCEAVELVYIRSFFSFWMI